ncbi:MAG TPA: AAA domain-containing protein [Ferruginibacter sp.]|nr:AAA domain-containing protein [Ferruginibacter sp.]HRE62469.1 AAA domain-containing protein [Ferruginibacter sp.]
MHPHIQQLIHCIQLEEEEQANRYQLNQAHSLKSLKAEGLALHPISVTRKSYGYADYPEISFRLPFPTETNLFKDNAAIECFCKNEEPIKGILLNLDGKTGEFRLFAPDFPEWIEDDAVGIKLAPDARTTGIMKLVLKGLENNKRLFQLFQKFHNSKESAGTHKTIPTTRDYTFFNRYLNQSQQQAVDAIVYNNEICIVHGPPGTGKTTTLTEAIVQLVARGEKVLVTAPSNAAVDNICKGLLKHQIHLLRVGNSGKIDDAVFPFTTEGKLQNSKQQKEIKQLKIRAEEFRRMALKYKRSFGKAEREQRNLLFKEVKAIRAEIKQIQHYNEEKLFDEATVIAGTPIGLYDAGIEKINFSQIIMDEAGQCLEPLAWCIFSFAQKIVLAGDHFQLPPTVLSQEALKLQFNKSILEVAIANYTPIHLLNVQYRMRPAIAGFPNQYFYNGELQNAPALSNDHSNITFIDTAGSGLNETTGADGSSLQNEGELKIIVQLISNHPYNLEKSTFISPYSGQVLMAKDLLPSELKCSTVDSYQGQEKENVFISLVRSNDENEIGFLKDYRRMNVAITRAKDQLIVIGDSACIGADPFYHSFLEYVEKFGNYRSVWEFNIS